MMGKDVNYIMGDRDRKDDPRFAEARALDEAQKRELRCAAEALTGGKLLARSRHAARAEALGQARDRVMRKLRDGKEN
jgi:hypothetical protein